jgi:hypothetical protein
VKLLLDNKLAPLTFAWGFLEASVDAVTRAYVRWQRRILHSVKVVTIDLPLADALRYLNPLDMGGQRVLFLTTKGRWTACFDNGAQRWQPVHPGRGGVATDEGPWHCRRCIPNTLTRRDARKCGTWGAVTFTLFAPEKRDFLNVRAERLGHQRRAWMGVSQRGLGAGV